MAFTIENGSIVAGANSYASISQARNYASERGITLPAQDADLQILLIKACDYLQSQENYFQGLRVSSAQNLAWPRSGAYYFNNYILETSIPPVLIQAQIELAIILNSGIDLLPVISASNYIVREKIGPIETEYANPVQIGMAQKFNSVSYLIEPLFKKTGFFSRRV